MAFIEPFLPLSGKNVLFQRIFLVLVLKRLKFHVTKPKNEVFSVIEVSP